MAQIRIIPAKTAFRQQSSQQSRLFGLIAGGRPHDHGGQTGGQAKGADGCAQIRHPALVVKSPQGFEHGHRLFQSGFGRGIQKRQTARIQFPPCRTIEHEGGQIAGQNFWFLKGLKRAIGCFGPEPIGNPCRHTTGATSSLIGTGARHAHRFQPRQTEIGLITRDACQTAVNDNAHILDGQRSFGNGGGQHDFAPPLRTGLDGKILRFGIHDPVKRGYQ